MRVNSMYAHIKKRNHLPVQEYIFFYGFCDTLINHKEALAEIYPIPQNMSVWTKIDAIHLWACFNDTENGVRLRERISFTTDFGKINEIMVKMENNHSTHPYASQYPVYCKDREMVHPWEFCIRVLIREYDVPSIL